MKIVSALLLFTATTVPVFAAFDPVDAYRTYATSFIAAKSIYEAHHPAYLKQGDPQLDLMRGYLGALAASQAKLEKHFPDMSEEMVRIAKEDFASHEEYVQSMQRWLEDTPVSGGPNFPGFGDNGDVGSGPFEGGANNGSNAMPKIAVATVGNYGQGGIGNGSTHREIPGFSNLHLIIQPTPTGSKTILENQFGVQIPIDPFAYHARGVTDDKQVPVNLGPPSGQELADRISTYLQTFSTGSKTDVEKLASELPLGDIAFLSQSVVRPATAEKLDLSTLASSQRQARAKLYHELMPEKQAGRELQSFIKFDRRLSTATLLNRLKEQGEAGQQLIPNLLKNGEVDIIFRGDDHQTFRLPVQKKSSVDLHDGALRIDNRQINLKQIEVFQPATSQ